MIIKKTCYRNLLLAALLTSNHNYAQNCGGMNIQSQADIASTCNFMVMTMIHDAANRPYLYVANKEGGLRIFNIATVTSPSLVATVPTTLFASLDVSSLSQNGNYLFLALGNSFTNPEQGGMAIIDVTNPLLPVVTDTYVVPGSGSGGGIVKVEGNYAYLGAMKSGLVVLDVSDKNNIQFKSQFIPSINYPPVINPNPDLYNARGMEVKNSIVYLCYDAGGIRVINCTNPTSPKESGRWCNPVMYSPSNHPKAYNNCILDGNYLYVAVDYAGMEVLNISDTAHISMTGWWNPYNSPNNNWFTCPVHANEMYYEKDCKRVFLSTGKSDMVVVDVSNPAQPDSCNFYGGVSNNLGTWGISAWQNQIYLSYICAFIPFSSSATSVKILSFNACVTGIDERNSLNNISISPNPVHREAILQSDRSLNHATLRIVNYLGQLVQEIKDVSGEKFSFSCEELPLGIFFVQVWEEGKIVSTARIITGK